MTDITGLPGRPSAAAPGRWCGRKFAGVSPQRRTVPGSLFGDPNQGLGYVIKQEKYVGLSCLSWLRSSGLVCPVRGGSVYRFFATFGESE